tara:strand:- start:532 stop:924 length:393 start_codon:yes stop_codon:yes gene_type:complete
MRKSKQDEQSPAFQFYAQDWISDPDRMVLSLEEQGAYVLLYCYCWRAYKIPHDVDVLAKMCNVSESEMEIIMKNISHFFTEKDGHWICIQAEEERKEQERNRRRRQDAGRKGAAARWGDKDGEDGSVQSE